MAVIRLFNTLGRAKEEFTPLSKSGVVGMYTCGPTVYQRAHLGNFRAYVFADTLKRVLNYLGYEVSQVINITDVGHLAADADEGADKIEEQAEREGKTVQEIAEKYTRAFFNDLRQLNIDTAPIIFPRATGHIPEMIDLIKKLEAKGFTYQTSDGIYFDIAKYPPYPELGRLDLAGMKAGARVEVNPEKRQPADFALWKFSRPEIKRQQEWDSPWGRGFPGWHIECSAMSMKYLGESFDIHTSGIDHIPVHHTNERAQSESATGKPFVKYWLHAGHVLIDGEKMAKSTGNTYSLDDLVKKSVSPLAYRYWLLTAHYRTQINFTWAAATGAQTALEKLLETIAGLPTAGQINPDYEKLFQEAISDDLDTPKAIALVWQLLKDKNISPTDRRATILDWDKVLGLNLETGAKQEVLNLEALPATVKKLVKEREDARAAKGWIKADELRDQIRAAGFEIKDTDEGPRLKKKTPLSVAANNGDSK